MWHLGCRGCVRCNSVKRASIRRDVWPSAVSRNPLCTLSMWSQLPLHCRDCRYDEGYHTTQTSDSENEEQSAEDVQTFQPMGSQRMEMRKRQTTGQQEATSAVQAPPDPGNRGPNACCFCWCCCCSCSCLTVRNEERNEGNRRSSYETKTEGTKDCDQRPMPSLEEVRCWGQSFDKLMKCPAGRYAFQEFLRTEFSEENMLFWMACEDLRNETNKSIMEEKARLIYEDYVSILSPKEVSLDSRVRDVINRNMLEPTAHAFDDAQLQIYTLMQRDSYPRFVNSAAYKTLMKTVSEQSPES